MPAFATLLYHSFETTFFVKARGGQSTGWWCFPWRQGWQASNGSGDAASCFFGWVSMMVPWGVCRGCPDSSGGVRTYITRRLGGTHSVDHIVVRRSCLAHTP